MNLKGIKITKKMYKRISELGTLNLKNTMLKGLDEFKKFTWSNFVKQEFDNLITCMEILEENGIFANLSDKQLFIVNYYTDVTEMDIATVFTDKDDNNIIIDIEFKTGSESCEKLDEQISKRVNDHMRQLFLREKYVIIAMNDDGFYKAVYYDSKENIVLDTIEELQNLTNNFYGNDYVETILTQANDLAGIHNLYKQMESGEFKYYEETKRTTEFIMEKINGGVKAIVCLSSPGTGKTVVAFKMFFENENTMFLIMNQKFYNSLGLTKYFIDGRCFFGTDAFLKNDLSEKIVIIDEVQRLSKEKILQIIKSSKATVLFGDTGQAFMTTDLDLDGHKLITYLKENGIYTYEKELKRSKRYNDSVEKALNFLTSRNLSLNEKLILEDYKINLFYDVTEFLNVYHNCKGAKKMYTTYDYKHCSTLLIGDEIFTMAAKDFYEFSISTGYENYIGHTLHAISFDVENNFVFLRNVCVINKSKKDILSNKFFDISTQENITKFLNELNILFTRGKKTLNIYTEDLEVYLYLNKKLKDIIQK